MKNKLLKKVSSVALSVLMIGSTVATLPAMIDSSAIVVSAAETYGDYQYNIENGTVTITKYIGSGGNVTIPSKINGKSVTSIGDQAFSKSKNLTSISIPDGVASIGNWAFAYTSLTNINIPDSVTSIGENTFYSCSKLTSITIPYGVKSLDGYTFWQCNSLTSIIIPDSVTVIDGWAFYGCDDLTIYGSPGSYAETYANSNTIPFVAMDIAVRGITLNKTSTTITKGNSETLTTTITPSNATNKVISWMTSNSSVATVSNGKVTAVAAGTANITAKSNNGKTATCTVTVTNPTVVEPTGITLSGTKTFNGVIEYGHWNSDQNALYATVNPSNATNKTVAWSVGNNSIVEIANTWSTDNGSGILVYGKSAGTTSITARTSNGKTASWDIVVQGSSDEYCGPNVTYYLDSNGTLTLRGTGDTWNYSNWSVFKNNTNIRKVIIEEGITSIGMGAFEGCSNISSVELPDSLTKVYSSAFSNTGISEITIPQNVDYLDDSALRYCYKLSTIIVDPNNQKYSSQDGVLLDKNKTHIILCPQGKTGYYVMPNSIGISGPPSMPLFYYCNKLTDISLGENLNVDTWVRIYGLKREFIKCSSLVNICCNESNSNYASVNGVLFSKDMKSIYLMPDARKGIYSVPDGTTSISTGAFINCNELSGVVIPESVTSIADKSIGYTGGFGDTPKIRDNISSFTIYGKSGSAAETYANNNGITFKNSSTLVFPTSISLNSSSLTKEVGNASTITATIYPSNATDKTVIWLTSNPKVATVSGGKVTAVATGTATITAVTNNGKTATCTVTVTNPTVEVTGITLNKTSTTIIKGNSETLTATITPSNATNKTVTWTTSNSSIATVSNGKVTAVAAGTATITAKSNNGKTATCTVTVTNPTVAVTGITLNKTSTTITKGSSETLTATITPSNATNKTVTWTTSNSSVATVSGGKVTAVAVGTATITAKSNNGKTATCTVTVVNPTVEVTGISLNKTSTTITKGNTETLTATISPSNATNKTVTWTTSNSSVATVSNGKVTAVAAGTATITAKSNNSKTATCTVTVVNPTVAVTGITLNKTSTTITKGNTETLTATISPSNATNKTVTWTTSNSSVATVAGGKITAVAAGTATITANSNNGKTATCTVTVVNPTVAVTGITLNKTSITITKGNSETLTATITPSNATNKTVTWTTSNSSVATVSGGKVTAVAAGTATITANSNNGKTATCTVTVKAPDNRFVWGQDNWNFDNSERYFTNGYSVNDNVMSKMQSDCGLSDYEIARIKQTIKEDNEGGFGGSCFGMTVSEIMAKQGDLKLSRYGCNDIVNKNSNTSNATSVINFIQELQGISTYNQLVREIPYMSGDHTQYDFIDKLETVLSNENQWVKLSYGIRILDKNSGKYYGAGSHAVLAYGVENCNYYSSVTRKTYDRRIVIADPNYLSYNYVYDDACLYYRSSDHSWIIPYWNQQNSSYAQLCYWNQDGNLSTLTGIIRNIMKYDSLVDVTNLMADYRVNHYIAGVEINNTSKNQTSVQQVKDTGNPNLDYSGSFGSGIARYDIEMDDSYNINENDEFYALWNPTANYEVSYTVPSDYYATMDYEGLVYFIDVTNSTYTLFKPNGYVSLRGANANYDISILTESDQCVTDWFSVGVSGKETDNLTYRKTKDGYVLSAQNLKNVTVNAENKNVKVKKTFSTDYDSVLIYEIDENTIGLKVDKDGNGTYETDITNQSTLKNISTLSAQTIKLGSSVTINAKATGGTAPYTYGVYYKKASSDKWITAQSYKANATVTFKPSVAVKYDVMIKVKDSKGTVAKKNFTVNVTKELVNNSTLSATTIKKGSSVTATAKASGGTGKYTYGVYYKKASSEKWTTAQSYGTNTTVKIKPAAAVKYDVCIKVKDSSGKIVKKYFTLTVTK